MKKYYLLIILFISSLKIFASCSAGFSEVVVKIIPDNYPSEVSWAITDLQGTIIVQEDSSASDTLCIPSTSCHLFKITDAFGDGIISPGGFWFYVDGVLIGNGTNFGFSVQYNFNCQPGNLCTNPLPLDTGTHTTSFENTWYDFTPLISGKYLLNTCGLNSCDTKLWVYEHCPAYPYPDGVLGAYAFNDSNNCGAQAVLNLILQANTNYYIRVGDSINSCSDSITFHFSYTGTIKGCMDINACNYNPLATENDSSCVYFPNPLCDGPDLKFDSTIFVQSLYLFSHDAQLCDVDEGCVTGYGTRYVISFTSHIDNIGTQDFYIGSVTSNPGQFNTNNCHGHAHYEGYGDYRLFDSNNKLIPVGHKNGFCVLDLCGNGQYTCSNMGISAGCYDVYESNTQCQWIDITDVPTGDYRMAVIINSRHLPDALGRYETNYINNSAQVCMHIDHNNGGVPTYNLIPGCSPYVDCLGVPGGNAEMDCNGICNGPGIYGDIFQDAKLDSQDVYTYLDLIQSSMPATTCNDLNGDSRLNIYDAALINWCIRGNPNHPGGSVHNHCNFPRNIINPSDSIGLSILNVDSTNNYLDIEILNPSARVKAYQFSMNGIKISSVVSLADPVEYPVDVRYIADSNEVFAISLEDSSLQRQNSGQALVRIYFSAITDTLICIKSVNDIINQDGERTLNYISGNCFRSEITSVASIVKQRDLVVLPNPAREKIYVHLHDDAGKINELKIMDVSGKIFNCPVQMIKPTWYEFDLQGLASGVYILKLQNDKSYGVCRFVKI